MAPATPMAPLSFHSLTPIGYIDGAPVWPALGGRAGGGLSFLVDDKDGDEPDEFDESDESDDEDDLDPDEGDEEPDDEEERPRSRQRREQEQQPDDEADSDWEPPTRAQWEKVQEALSRNNNEMRKRRMAGKVFEKIGLTSDEDFSDWLLERGIDPENGERVEGLPEDADHEAQGRHILSQRRAEERGQLKAEAKYRPALVQFAAAAALSEAGYAGKDIGPILRMLDIEGIEIEFERGEPVLYGLDEQVTELKTTLPQLFRKAAPADADGEKPPRRTNNRSGRSSTGRTGARAIDGGSAEKRTGAKPLTWLQQADRQLRGLPPRR